MKKKLILVVLMTVVSAAAFAKVVTLTTKEAEVFMMYDDDSKPIDRSNFTVEEVIEHHKQIVVLFGRRAIYMAYQVEELDDFAKTYDWYWTVYKDYSYMTITVNLSNGRQVEMLFKLEDEENK